MFESATALVYPSLYEGFGLPLLEAMNAKIPILTSYLSSLPEVAGSAAVYVNPFSEKSIAEGLEYLVDTPAKQQELIRAGQAQLQHFQWNQTVNQVKQLWRQVLGE